MHYMPTLAPSRRFLALFGASLLKAARCFSPSLVRNGNFGWNSNAVHTLDWERTRPIVVWHHCSNEHVHARLHDGHFRRISRRFRFLSTIQDSWETDVSDDVDSITPGDELDTDNVDSDNVDSFDDDASKSLDPLIEHQQWAQAVEKAMSALQKKRASLEKELQKTESIEKLQNRADLLKTNRHVFSAGITSATIHNWETGQDETIQLDSDYASVGDELDGIYAMVKRLKRGKEAASNLLEQTNSAISTLFELERDLTLAIKVSADSSTTVLDTELIQQAQDRLVQSSRQTKFVRPAISVDSASRKTSKASLTKSPRSSQSGKPKLGTPASNVRKLMSDAGCTILVGRNRRGNEYLAIGVARDDDIWMHARGSPGAHVLVLQRRGSEYTQASPDCLQLAANLAAFYSDARSERKVDVIAAEPKHVLKPRGAPLGAVKVREELQVFSGRPDDVPDDLKEARAESGQSDEYRRKDKSKLRKQNKQQAIKQKKAVKQKVKAKTEKKQQEQAENFY